MTKFNPGDILVLSDKGREFFTGEYADDFDRSVLVFDHYEGYYNCPSDPRQTGKMLTIRGRFDQYTASFFEHAGGPW